MSGAYLPPCPILPRHSLTGFDSGKPELDDWLKARAIGSEGKSARTIVITDAPGAVVAYRSLATGHTLREEVPGKIRHNLPRMVPLIILARLAVDKSHHGKGLGSSLLKDAFQRTVQMSEIAGVRALIVHAIDEAAVDFYRRYGFEIFPQGTRTLIMPIETVIKATGV